MSGSYFVIELSARWLVALIAALALSLIVAFAFGYGAAWTVLGDPIDERPAPVVATATPTVVPIETEVVIPTATPTAAAQTPQAPTATPPPSPTATPAPTRPPEPTATPAQAAAQGFFVQVVASSNRAALNESRKKLAAMGFDADHQIIVSEAGNGLHKLRIGPFPDRSSADRVQLRMKGSGFADAWVVAP